MAAANHDRNLLFGILAVQMDFISREALISAMNAWVLAKDKPLGEILVTQKALVADRRTLLEALVEEHLKQHGNDAAKSLAAVSSIGTVEEDLRKIPDPDVQASLVHVATATRTLDPYATRVESGAAPTAVGPVDPYATLPQAAGSTTTPFAAPAPSAGGSTAAFGSQAQAVGGSTTSGRRFRVLRFHAKGGLGQVSVARDEELQRDVALKEIQERHADNLDSRSRFMLEAEVTGALEHPGIVPVYGLGTYADGRPYYAMRFIRGDSLEEAVKRFHKSPDKRMDSGQRALELRGLLGRFVDVCNAIAYAHSRGVLHRDLKPGNIMLGQYGETLVVDWGLAKTQDSDTKTESVEGPVRLSSISSSSATLMGSAVGTPQYMSPEQASGRLDLLGPATDVYSLGATLYCVLTGRPPLEGLTVDIILNNVQRGDFPAPRTLNDQIPRPLEAICLKAMALKPGGRYPSPKDLADDVEHWLADEPVSAYREGWPAVVARWARKHKTLVASSFALIVVVAIALAVTTVLVKQEQLKTEAARQEAVAARDTARRRFGLALDTINDLVQGIQTKLEVRPTTEDLRKDLLESARKRVQQLLQEAERQGNPDQTLVWSYFRMGDVDQVIGDTAAAQKEYLNGSQLAEKLAAADPSNSSALSDQGISYINLGRIAQQLGRTQEAIDEYHKALAVRQHRVELDPKDPKAQRGLSISYELLGDVTLRAGRTQEALDFYRKAAAIRQALSEADATNVQARYDLSVIYERLGDVTQQLGQTQEALDFYQKERAIRQRLADADPKNTLAQRNLSVSLERLGDTMQRLGRTAEARDFYQKAAAICQGLAEADPKNAQAQRDLGVAYTCVGDISKQLGQTAEALDIYRKVLAIYLHLAEADPKNAQGQNDLTISYDRLGDATSQLKQSKEAIDYYQQARAIRERLAAADPKNLQAQRNLTISYNKLGGVSQQLGQTKEALDYYQKALAIRERLAADAKNSQAQRDLSFSYDKLGDVTLQFGQAKEALDVYQKALAIDERLAEADPENVQDQAGLLADYYSVARGFARRSASGDKDAREKDAQQSVDFLRKAVAKGYKDLAHLKQDKDFDALRERDNFKKLIVELEKAGDGK